MLDVMFYEVFKEEEIALKKFLKKNIKAGFTAKTVPPGLSVPPAKIISIRTQSLVPDSWAHQLEGILTRSTGYDHLREYRRKTSTPAALGHLGDYCARAVAEQAVLMTLALTRKLKEQLRHFDTFDRDGMTGLECRGLRLLVVGVGNIGSEVVDIARGLRMEVKGVDIQPKVSSLKYVSLSVGLSWAQAVICALPLTDKTRAMLNYKVFKKGRPGIVFVNVSRGEVSPSRDLARLVKEGALAGLGMDVFENEPELAGVLRQKKRPASAGVKALLSLKDRPSVIFTPHNAFNTRESLERKARLSAESISFFLAKQKFPRPV